MQPMLILILITIMFLVAGNIILRIFFEMIQGGGALDVLFGWQNMLANMYGSPNKYKQLLGKALGDCERCTSFWFMPLWYVCYYVIAKYSFGIWVTANVSTHSYMYIIFINIVWYSLFHALGAQGGLIILTKLFKKQENVL